MSKALYFIIYKPYKVLSQFTDEKGNPGLGSIFKLPSDVYPVGRLDLDSEGLLILTNDKTLNHRLLNPAFKHRRTYWAEVEGQPDNQAIETIRQGIEINLKGTKHITLPAEATLIAPDSIIPREPPVNYKKHPHRSWVALTLTEGKNRQVRRMLAAVGHPVLRLIRVGIEDLSLEPLKPGEITQISEKIIYKKLSIH